MKTTLDIKEALLRRLRRRAAEMGRPFGAVLEEILELGLSRAAQPGRAQRRFRVRPHALRLKPKFRGISLNQLYDQIEVEGPVRNL